MISFPFIRKCNIYLKTGLTVPPHHYFPPSFTNIHLRVSNITKVRRWLISNIQLLSKSICDFVENNKFFVWLSKCCDCLFCTEFLYTEFFFHWIFSHWIYFIVVWKISVRNKNACKNFNAFIIQSLIFMQKKKNQCSEIQIQLKVSQIYFNRMKQGRE